MAPNNAFAFFSTHYQFMDDFKVLQTRTNVLLFIGDGKKQDIDKPAYFNNYVYQSPAFGNGGESSIKVWAADEGKLVNPNPVQFLKQDWG
ncbi:MAG: hypothetical protein GW763_16220 [Paraglaciecola sp.]|nr:hypothetical protein [Paraglaciecola sp.]NCT49499.1 hypothetical protein [Paraglaciecola sp.]